MTAVLLTLAVLFGLVVPFDVFAEEEEPATGSDIHAMLYYIDPNKTTQSGSIDITKNLELVFQRGGDVDPDKVLFKHFIDFEDGKTRKPAKETRGIARIITETKEPCTLPKS